MRRILLLAAAVPLFASAGGADWSECSAELDRLRRAARDAQVAADEVASAADHLEAATDALDQCRSYPETYDLMSDDCQMKRYDVESAASNFESARSDLAGYLDALSRRARAVNMSCEVGVEISIEPQEHSIPSQVSICPAIRALARRVTTEKFSSFCSEALSLSECIQCL